MTSTSPIVDVWPCGKLRRVEYPSEFTSIVEIHKLCDLCNHWYDSKDTGQYYRYVYCVNCKPQFADYVKSVDEDTYNQGKRFGVFK